MILPRSLWFKVRLHQALRLRLPMPGLTGQLATPPQWLRKWRSFVKNLIEFPRHFFVTMTTAVRLGILPDSVYEAVPPELDVKFAHPAGTCPHPDYVRYGNAYGKFARCKQCLKRWRWNADRQQWVEHLDKAFDCKLLSSRPPLPSSSNTVPAGSLSAPSSPFKPSTRASLAAATPKRSLTAKRPSRRARPSSSSEMDVDPWRMVATESEYNWADEDD